MGVSRADVKLLCENSSTAVCQGYLFTCCFSPVASELYLSGCYMGPSGDWNSV